MDFLNVEIQQKNFPDFEDIEFTSISRKFGWIIIFNWSIFSIVLPAGLFILNFFQPLFFGIYFRYVLIGLILFLFVNYIISYFNFFTKKYAIRTHDIIYQHGLIKNTTTIIPFNRIQHLDLEEGWLSRIFDIKSISVYTAGQSSGDIKINGLEKKVAEKINQIILNYIKKEEISSEAEIFAEIPENES